MKEHPILFSTAMVQAILAGRKTMTRREGDLKEINQHSDRWLIKQEKREVFEQDGKSNTTFWRTGSMGAHENFSYPVVVGDRLWVRETWTPLDENGDMRDKETGFPVAYYANFFPEGSMENHKEFSIKWKPSIHLKKEHSRIWLEVTEVRVEHLFDMSEEDAIAEGVKFGSKKWLNYRDEKAKVTQFVYNCESARQSFRSLWELINGRESYLTNPWVWVIGFKVLSTTGKPADEATTTINLKGAPLAKEMAEYFTELFTQFKHIDHVDIRDAETMQCDLQARFGREFDIKDVELSLQMHSDEGEEGSFRIKRTDLYIPQEGDLKPCA